MGRRDLLIRFRACFFTILLCIADYVAGATEMRNYAILMHSDILTRAVNYHESLKAGAAPGAFLKKQLEGKDVAGLSIEAFVEKLLQTKKPMIFAESAVVGDGSDWTSEELSLLGFISIATPVMIFDNGLHANPKVHAQPFAGTLLFSAGALLGTGAKGRSPADWDAVVTNNKIDAEAFYRFYEKRLLPVFLYADRVAAVKGRKAFITVPGLGCGMFAGPFVGRLGAELQRVLHRFLHEHGAAFRNIKALFYGPYNECENARHELHGISYLVRPFLRGNDTRPQLCHPTAYAEDGDDFSDCEFFSIVAWDHVSWPGNDYYGGSRSTDDGVKAAATSSMQSMTGFEGHYDARKFCYLPPAGYLSWHEVVTRNHLRLEAAGRLQVFP